MLIKIPDADPDFVESLKSITGKATGSKAYVAAAEAHADLRAQIGDLMSENASLRRRLDVALQTIEGARSAAAQLLEKTAQVDMFSKPDVSSVSYKDKGLELLNKLRAENGLRQRDR